MSWSSVRAELTSESGQRPYGPTVTEAVLTFRREYRAPSHATPDGLPCWVSAERAIAAFRALVNREWKDPSAGAVAWHEPRLTRCEPLEATPQPDGRRAKPDRSDRWLVRVEEPYLD